jgi:type IV pilus assembly protein PilZ
MSDFEFIEKRKYPRTRVEVEIHSSELPYEQQKGKGMLCFLSVDLSGGGIFLETTMPLEPGAVIYMKFSLPDSERQIITQARVVRANGKDSDLTPGMGIEFQHLGFSDKKEITEFVKKKGCK